jgi:hypothetical protein
LLLAMFNYIGIRREENKKKKKAGGNKWRI